MTKLMVLVAALAAAAAYALPGDLLVVSTQEVRPDEGAGLYYLGTCSAGYLYNGSAAALAQVAPYRTLDTNADEKEYYLVWAPGYVTLDVAAFKQLGFATRLGPYELLVGVKGGGGGEAIRAVEYRTELARLEPVTPLDWKYRGESPPTAKDPAIEAAVNTITAAEYGGYVQTLQDFQTRDWHTSGNAAAQAYLAQFFEAQGLDVTVAQYPYHNFYIEDIVGERTGDVDPEHIIIICAHFDSSSEAPHAYAPGADDNASGTACVMAAARALKACTFNRTVRFIGFDGEEEFIAGSSPYARECAERGDKIVAVMNADMVGYDEEFGARDDYAVAYETPSTWLWNYLLAVGALYGNNLIYDKAPGYFGDGIRFASIGYPTIEAIEGAPGPGGTEKNPVIHTKRDIIDYLTLPLATRFTRDYAATVAHLAASTSLGIDDPDRPPAPPKPYAFAYYPNPYRIGAAGVKFVGVSAPATLAVYDLAGRKVAAAKVPQGETEYLWQPGAGAFAPGVYIFRLEGEGQKETGKIAVVR